MNLKNYKQAVNFLESLSNLPIRDYMENHTSPTIYIKRTQKLLDKLGNPEKSFKFIHVSGTSGKGSTCAMIQSILTSAKIKTGVFFSPHTTTTIERFKIGNKYIDPDEFTAIVNEITPIINNIYLNSQYGRPSYFEIMLAIALLYFKKKKCTYVILEVGCGGKYDATNVIKCPEISIITNISLDHMQILGNSKEEIARDKSGIIKKNSIFLTTEKSPALRKIFRAVCQQQKTDYIYLNNPTVKIKTNLLGEHQKINATLATKTVGLLNIKKRHIEKGLLKVKIPCRLEIMQKNPMVILDGAHNPQKIKSVKETIKDFKFKKVFIILSLAQNKNIKEVTKIISPLADKIFITRYNVAGRECAQLKLIASWATKYKKQKTKLDINLNPWHSLRQALKEAGKNDLILITGSFYLAGELRTNWISENYILKKRTSFK